MNTRSTTSRRAFVAAAVTAPVLLAPLAVASPAAAHRPPPRPAPRPVVQVEPTWRFQIGAQVDRTTASQQYFGDIRVFHQAVPVRLMWSGYAPGHARIAWYDLYQYRYTGQIDQLLRHTRATSYDYLHVDVAHPEVGPIGPRLNPRFRLVATDTQGRRATVDPIQRHPEFSEQEDGTTYQDGRSVFPSAPTAGYGWYRRSGPAYDAGKVLTTQRPGAALRIPVSAHGTGQWLALEMTTGPRMGAAEVRVDGRRVGVVDTYARTVRPRVLVAEYRLTPGRHTVTLVNLGLHHRSTVELDGVFASDWQR